jgi:hypothetical protein
MKYVLLILTIFSGKLCACSDFNRDWTPEQWIEGSDSIYHGMVVSISLDKKSIYNGESDPLFNAISLRGDKHITFKVYESLKGKKKSVVKAILPECFGGVTKFGDSAILFKVKNVWHIKSLNADLVGDKASKILAQLSKVKNKSEL